MNKTLFKWELAGILFIFILGSLFHFIYEWSGRSIVIAMIAPVNESVWEHFKMAFWPGFLFALVEYRNVIREGAPFWYAQSMGLLMMPLAIALIFYSYTAIVGRHYLVADIITFLFAVILGRTLTYYIRIKSKKSVFRKRLGITVIFLMMAASIIFTFLPPKNSLFLDKNTIKGSRFFLDCLTQ